ncbi:MAG: FRG domain-containing protein [Rhodoglobus sp.]
MKQFTPADGRAWYRGQVDADWKLKPSVQRRREWIDTETAMLTRFRQLTVSRVVRPPEDDWGWICLAQHHRLPTRLLDWSENPLVGLYFAVEEDEGVDGKVFAMNPHGLNTKNFGSDIGVLLLGRDERVDPYSPYKAGSAKASPLAVVAPQRFDRVVAQAGTFTVTHHLDAADFETDSGSLVESWVIPLTKKQDIRNELAMLGISAATVYPDLDRISVMIRQEML